LSVKLFSMPVDPFPLAYLSDLTTPEERGKVLGQLSASVAAGLVCGPALGVVIGLSLAGSGADRTAGVHLAWILVCGLGASLPLFRHGRRRMLSSDTTLCWSGIVHNHWHCVVACVCHCVVACVCLLGPGTHSSNPMPAACIAGLAGVAATFFLKDPRQLVPEGDITPISVSGSAIPFYRRRTDGKCPTTHTQMRLHSTPLCSNLPQEPELDHGEAHNAQERLRAGAVHNVLRPVH